MNDADPTSDQHGPLPLYETTEGLYDLASCGYLTTTADGQILKANQTFSKWLGYAPEELLSGKRFVELLTVGGRMFFETHVNLLLRVQHSVEEIALDFICKDGNVLSTLVNGRQNPAGSNYPALNLYAVFKATERRTYERELLAARDLLRTTLSSIGDAVVSTDAEGRVTFMNPVAEKLSGWDQDEARGKAIQDVVVLVREDTSAPIENPVLHALRVGKIVGLANHTTLISKSGNRIPVDDSASPIHDDNGTVIGGVLIFRDISKQRQIQRELTEAQALAQTMIVELQRSNGDLAQFAAVASHDLRSPLNNIMQFAQLLERRHGDALGDGKELLGILITSAKRMGMLIEDLLRYARITSSVSVLNEPVDANSQLKAAIDNLQASISKSGAVVTHDVLPIILLDQTHLLQIFQNLIGNAIHYRSQEAPRIHLAATREGEMFRFSCTDNGVGIDPEYHAQIFEPFKRLHGSDRPGSGIGLATCKRIVERAGGEIWVESRVGEGSTFFFTLPKASRVEGE